MTIPDCVAPNHPDIPATQNSVPAQQLITQWTTFHPFIPHIPSTSSSGNNHPNHPRQEFQHHLNPFGTSLPPIDHTKTLQVCMQNTQHSFKIYGDGLDITSMIDNLKYIGASMFTAISPNINWTNTSNWIRTKQIFHPSFNQVHLSAISSDIVRKTEYFTKSLTGSPWALVH
jgi:hypothetical protein